MSLIHGEPEITGNESMQELQKLQEEFAKLKDVVTRVCASSSDDDEETYIHNIWKPKNMEIFWQDCKANDGSAQQ